jgi:hypothetical protein
LKLADIGSYIAGLFENHLIVTISAIGAFLYRFFFPEQQYLCGAAAVLGIMILDLLTRLFALARTHGGLKKACTDHIINSHSFGKGTFDKLVVFGIMMVICGLAYRLTVISSVAAWFTQVVFTLMFLRDLLSVIENLMEAGVSGLGLFKKIVTKKINDYCEDPTAADCGKTTTSTPVEPTPSSSESKNENTDHL